MARQPKTLTKEELVADSVCFPRDKVLEIPPAMLALLDAELRTIEGWGLNPARVRIGDFDTAMVISPLAQVPGLPPSPDFVSMVFRHYLTDKIAGGFGVAVPTQYPTAIVLTQLAVPSPKS
jgi:hypothetical protein